MLTRRHLRIKAMQALYGFYQSEDRNALLVSEKNMVSSIEKIYDLYFYLTALLIDIHFVANNVLEEAKTKRLPSEADLNPNRKFVDNPILVSLVANQELERHIQQRKISWQNESDVVRKMFGEIRASELYKNYMDAPGNDMNQHKNFLMEIIVNVFSEHEMLNYWLEDKNIHWGDDVFVALSTLAKTIEFADGKGKITIPPLLKNHEEDMLFVKDLLVKCVMHNDELQDLIADKTANWDMDRIASMDVLLMKMALTEVLYFHSIPVKVSMNEYIDISKEYSTPKSKIFINGILDKIIIDLKTQNKITKTGRGLVEN